MGAYPGTSASVTGSTGRARRCVPVPSTSMRIAAGGVVGRASGRVSIVLVGDGVNDWTCGSESRDTVGVGVALAELVAPQADATSEPAKARANQGEHIAFFVQVLRRAGSAQPLSALARAVVPSACQAGTARRRRTQRARRA